MRRRITRKAPNEGGPGHELDIAPRRTADARARRAGRLQHRATSPEGRERLIERGATALREWNAEVPGIEAFARQSHGYAIFPGVGKGGLGVGLAYGRGVVYAQGQHIGYADVAQASLGLQAGGQAYRLLVVFDDGGAVGR